MSLVETYYIVHSFDLDNNGMIRNMGDHKILMINKKDRKKRRKHNRIAIQLGFWEECMWEIFWNAQ